MHRIVRPRPTQLLSVGARQVAYLPRAEILSLPSFGS